MRGDKVTEIEREIQNTLHEVLVNLGQLLSAAQEELEDPNNTIPDRSM
jgi:hypothetical protein